MKIYIIEDDKTIREELSELLTKYGYKCIIGSDFKNIVSLCLKEKPDLILVDINLPFQDGFGICKELRKETTTPIIMLTSRNEDIDELLSLNCGADDFITKPYNIQILLARIQNILKRTYEVAKDSILQHRGLSVNLLKGTMIYEGQEIELTRNELGILSLLIANKDIIIPREKIIEEIWNIGDYIDENTLNVNMGRLRKKLDNIGLDEYIITKRGVGYRV